MEGLSRKEILEEIPNLHEGSFDYWARFRAEIKPIGRKAIGRFLIEIYPDDCIDKIKAAMKKNKTKN